MKLTELAVTRPVAATVLSLLILVLGGAALLRLPVREYPDVDDPTVTVTIVYPGAAAEVVEREVTERIEEAVSAVDGIRRIRSQSRDGRARVEAEFTLDRNLDLAAADIRDRLSSVREDLPDEAEEPEVSQQAIQSQVIMWLVLTSDTLDLQALSDFAERTLVDRLSTVEGVASVLFGGGRRYAMRIWLDLERMAARNVTVLDVAAALRSQNVELPAGRLISETRELTVRTLTELERPEAYRALVLREQDGVLVTLGDVARVEYGPENLRTAVRFDGSEAVGLGIVRQTGSNAIAVADAVRERLKQLDQRIPQDIDVTVAYDASVFIAASIRQIVETFFLTVTLVVGIVFVSLGSWRSALVPAATIPASVAGAFIVLYFFGFSVNVLTLLALILAIGMLIDDAIVVSENVFRHSEAERPRLLAADRGAGEVAFAVLATTLVLLSVISPLALLTGDSGRLFTEFAAALGGALAFSSLVALTLGTTLASLLIEASKVEHGRLHRWTTGAFDRAGEAYARLLRRVLAARWIVIGLAVVLAGGTIWLYQRLPRELSPREDRGSIFVPITGPEGASLEAMLAVLDQVEAVLLPQLEASGPGRHVISIVAPRSGGQGPVNSAIVIFRLKDWDRRDEGQFEVTRALIPAFGRVTGAQVFAVDPPSLGQEGFTQPVQVVFSADSLELAYDAARSVLEEARRLPQIAEARLDYQPTNPQVRITIDRDRAAAVGVSMRDIGRTLQIAIGGEDITDFALDAETYEVMVRAEPDDRTQPESLLDVYVRAKSGELVPLSGFIDWSVVGRASERYRTDQLPSVTLQASLGSSAALGDVLDRIEGIARDSIPPGVLLGFLGPSEDYVRSSNAFWIAFGLAIVIVYLVLAAQFESFVQPIVLLAGVPLALFGALLASSLAGRSLNLFSQIGLILAVGIMAKNAILLVEFANQLRDRGRDPREALEEAARVRFRPIVMTSIATLFGAIPLALSTGPGAEVRASLGFVIIGGIVSATLMALLLVPPLYLVMTSGSRSRGATERALAQARREADRTEREADRTEEAV
ncbi:MAG: efflux RND transporter permease subunit [Myxococcota bacterium]